MYFPGKPQLKGAWIDITLEEDQLYHRRSVAPSVVWSCVLERSVQKNLSPGARDSALEYIPVG